MLTRDGVIARYIFAFCFYFLSGTEMVTGWMAAISGTLGTVELATALLRYSPWYELYEILHTRYEQAKSLKSKP